MLPTTNQYQSFYNHHEPFDHDEDSALAPTPIGNVGIKIVDKVSLHDILAFSSIHNNDDVDDIREINHLLSALQKNIDNLKLPQDDMSSVTTPPPAPASSTCSFLTSSLTSRRTRNDNDDHDNDQQDFASFLNSDDKDDSSDDNHGDIFTPTGGRTNTISAPSEQTPHARTLQNCKWLSKYQELCEYKKDNGHCLVPHNWPMNLPLAKWVKRQRYQYKLRQQGKHNTMTDEREVLLEEVGFVWDSHRAAWEERVNDLREFKREHGHCNVPSNYKKNRQLSIWVKYQRQRHKLYCKGEQNSMTEERVRELSDIGFIWALRNESSSL